MTQTLPERHICLAFDRGYRAYAYVLLASVLKHNTDALLIVHAIAGNVGADEKADMVAYVQQHGGRMHFYELDEATTRHFVVPTHEGAYLTLAMYYRLFFPHLVPDKIKKLLYVDIDTLVVGNLKELFATDLGQYAFGAVLENEMPLRTDLGLQRLEDYFNTGVLLMNLPEWRAQRITEHAIEIAVTQSERIQEYGDQDVLNLLAQGHWYRLDPRYNLMKAYIPHDLPQRDYSKFLSDKVIIHFNGRLKAWHRACENKLRFLYPRYLNQLPTAYGPYYVGYPPTWQGLWHLAASRTLETYFNYPALGQMWRSLKKKFGR